MVFNDFRRSMAVKPLRDWVKASWLLSSIFILWMRKLGKRQIWYGLNSWYYTIYRSFLFRILGIFSVDFICKVMVASAVKVCDSVLYHLSRDGIIEDLHCLVDWAVKSISKDCYDSGVLSLNDYVLGIFHYLVITSDDVNDRRVSARAVLKQYWLLGFSYLSRLLWCRR